MLRFYIIVITLFFTIQITSQELKLPSYLTMDTSLTNELKKIVKELELDKDFDVGEDGVEQISLAVIDLNGNKPLFGTVNADNFIYPASVYKMYVAASIMQQVSQGDVNLFAPYIIKGPNAVDKSKEIKVDPRPLLKEGDTVNINYLLDLMITRSDNSAANCLIDIATRDRINKFIAENNWTGSEVTRKFLSRKFEDPGYEKIRSTETCALHAADYFYKLYTGSLVNQHVSQKLLLYLGNQLDNSKLETGLPGNTIFYHKTGWFSYWTNDVGLVVSDKVKFIISCFLPIKEDIAKGKMKLLAEKIYQLMLKRI